MTDKSIYHYYIGWLHSNNHLILGVINQIDSLIDSFSEKVSEISTVCLRAKTTNISTVFGGKMVGPQVLCLGLGGQATKCLICGWEGGSPSVWSEPPCVVL